MVRFIFLYAAMYAAFGVASPFLPAFVSERGLPADQLGIVLGAAGFWVMAALCAAALPLTLRLRLP